MESNEQALDRAMHFINKETAFHLGNLVTEQSHHITQNLSSVIQNDIETGIALLLKVDRDIFPVAEKVTESAEMDFFVQAIVSTIKNGGRLIFSSCGASGRLAIILEAMWREFWTDNSIGNQTVSIMTGGERALIRSVENFEDYQSFGRQQAIEAEVGEKDLLIALTEGGEISSVIGTMKEAVERGAKVFMFYNNPRDLLIEKFDRSREVLTHPDISSIELTTGPMALGGSTRMQATTIGMLIVGIALEEAICDLKKTDKKLRSSFVDSFRNLVGQLSEGEALKILASFVKTEGETYKKSGKITYLATRYLLDIFSDTSERTPTFMIPPFKPIGDTQSPEPWAFAKDPERSSLDAWNFMLRRMPRGLEWKSEDYRRLEADLYMVENPPKLSQENILSYPIGNEFEAARSGSEDKYIIIKLGDDLCTSDSDSARQLIGNAQLLEIAIPVDLLKSQLNLFEHLAFKLILNTVSTGTMAYLGRIKGNWMVQVDATNKKLIDRATRIIQHFSGLNYESSCIELFKTIHNPDIDRSNFKVSYVVQTLSRLGVDF